MGRGIRGDEGPATGEDGWVDVRPESTESRDDWKDEFPVSSSDLEEAGGRCRSLRKKSAAVVSFGLSSSEAPFCGGDDVGGHDGFGGTFSGFVVEGGVEGGSGEVWEEGVEVTLPVPPPRKRRTPFMACYDAAAYPSQGCSAVGMQPAAGYARVFQGIMGEASVAMLCGSAGGIEVEV